jgi:hypothetical protein
MPNCKTNDWKSFENIVFQNGDIYIIAPMFYAESIRMFYEKCSENLNKNVMTLEALVPMDLGSYVCIATKSDGERAQNTIVFSRRSDYGNHFEFKIDGPSEPSEEEDDSNNNNDNSNNNESLEEIVNPQDPKVNDQEKAPENKILEGDRLSQNEGK